MFVCLDIETTGLNPREDHVIEVAIVRFDHEKILDEWKSLVKPSINIPEFTKRLTGIDDEMVDGAPRLAEIADTIREKVGDAPVMGHFIFFDLNFLSTKEIPMPNEQLDTCQLTQILLPNEASYSLEVLTEKLGISQPDAHRALDDVKANIELFWLLSAHIRALPEGSRASLTEILEKSTWPWAEHLLPILSETQKPEDKLIPQIRQEKVIQSEQHANLTELTKDLQQPFLLEETSHTYLDLINYASSLDGNVLLSVPQPESLPTHEEVGMIKHPNQYVDEDRLQSFLAKDTLDTTETMLAAKLKLWLSSDQADNKPSGDRGDIRIVKEENHTWFDICCQEHDTPNSFYKRALELASAKKIMAVSTNHFLKEASRKEPSIKMPANLVLSGVENIVKEIEFAWHLAFSESHFINDLRRLKEENPDAEEATEQLMSKVSILFGFLGMFMQKHADGAQPYYSLDLKPFHRSTMEWSKVSQSAASIQSALSELKDAIKPSPNLDELEKHLLYASKILQSRTSIIWLSFTQDQQPILHTFPENSSQIFKERVWKNAENLHLFCHHGDLSDDFKFLKTELSLPEEIQTKKADDIFELPLLEVQTHISSPNDHSNPKQVTHELDLQMAAAATADDAVEAAPGNIFLLVTSNKAGESFFYTLKNVAEKHDRKLFVQNMSGGMGKILKMAERTDGTNIFVGRENLMDFLLSEGVNLKTLAIQRLPFARPNSSIQSARAKMYQDAYKEFALPQAALRFRGLLNRFLGNSWEDKKILILDPRIRDYGGVFY